MLYVEEVRRGYAVVLGTPWGGSVEVFRSGLAPIARAECRRLSGLLGPVRLRASPPKEPKIGRRLGPAKPDAATLSPQQVAGMLGVSRSTVDRMARDGTLPGVVRYRQGANKGMYSVNRKVLEQWIEQGEKK